MRILCVEDDPDSREMMILLLELAGYEVVTARSALDGLELSSQGNFDLIILDNWYEIGSGVELCKQIRSFDKHTPIVFYSGAVYESDIQGGLESGAQRYLIKPMGIRDLIQTIEELTYHESRLSAIQ